MKLLVMYASVSNGVHGGGGATAGGGNGGRSGFDVGGVTETLLAG